MTGASNNGGEDSPGGVITGETSLAHAGAIVNDKSGNVFVTHVDRVWEILRSEHTQELATSVGYAHESKCFYTWVS